MAEFNINNSQSIEENYNQGLLPQRNNKDVFYKESSCRSNLLKYKLSSENRRIIQKTQNFTYQKIPITSFTYDHSLQKQLSSWTKELQWNIPVSSIKNLFTNHIFNQVYIWKNEAGEIIAYSLCYFSDNISHIAHVFYHPDYNHSNLPIRMVLQVVIDSFDLNLKYCYLGGFWNYKRNMPGFELFDNNRWIEYNKGNIYLTEN